jgi:hypothetical protein
MPLDLLALAFVVAGFIAVAFRFAPLDASGARRLPRAVDDSVGMYTIRRLLGRPTDAPDAVPDSRVVEPPPREIATSLDRESASPAAPLPALAIDDVAPLVGRPIAPIAAHAVAPAGADLVPLRIRRNPALEFQRRLAGGLVALLVVAVVTAVAVSVDSGGGVLAATGVPSGRPLASTVVLP